MTLNYLISIKIKVSEKFQQLIFDSKFQVKMFSQLHGIDEDNAANHRQANEAKILRNKLRMFTMMVYKYFCNANFTEELDIDIQQQLGQVFQSVTDFLDTIDIRQNSTNSILFETASDEVAPSQLIDSMRSRLNNLSRGAEQNSSILVPIYNAVNSLIQFAETNLNANI